MKRSEMIERMAKAADLLEPIANLVVAFPPTQAAIVEGVRKATRALDTGIFALEIEAMAENEITVKIEAPRQEDAT